MATSVRGVFLLKLPSYKARLASVAIEINPVDASGSPTKKRGISIRSASELNEINSILTNPKLAELARNIDTVNPKRPDLLQLEVQISLRFNIFEVEGAVMDISDMLTLTQTHWMVA
jgi:hypothetical protein